ncbi:MAG: peptide chain release factor N(5)-glutamine methyltransferase [Gammaproteobacteria bacterium]|nr:peptide chain release factor N(5)-glutamine methyltransferase [Gammaproteobacteria bacterium]
MSITGDAGALHAELFEVLAGAGIDDPHSETTHILESLTSAPSQAARERALAMARARAAGTPLGYVVGQQRFMGVDITVMPGVLIPRSETELLGWEAVVRLRASHGATGLDARVIDMCCGSGNLACGIAHALPQVRVWASDLMENCATLTRHNACQLGLEERIHVHHGDLFQPLCGGPAGYWDLVVCNPPYISTQRLSRRHDLLHHEPRAAFDGGPYGLSIYHRLIRDASHYLSSGGWLLLEIGSGQAGHIERLFARSPEYDKIELVADQRGEFRVAAARRADRS